MSKKKVAVVILSSWWKQTTSLILPFPKGTTNQRNRKKANR
jgi:hypothetical protein